MGLDQRDNQPMKKTDTAGARLVKLLDEGLPSGIVWTANERAILGLISDHADRVEALKALQASELAKPEVISHRVVEIVAEIRTTQAQIARMVAGLDPEMANTAKSVRHQQAAYARWNGVGVSGPA
jgi:hypothetical protein